MILVVFVMLGCVRYPYALGGECATERSELINQLASLSPGLSVHVRNGLVTMAVLLAEVAAGAMALAAEFGNGSGVAQSLSVVEVLASFDAIDCTVCHALDLGFGIEVGCG